MNPAWRTLVNLVNPENPELVNPGFLQVNPELESQSIYFDTLIADITDTLQVCLSLLRLSL